MTTDRPPRLETYTDALRLPDGFASREREAGGVRVTAVYELRLKYPRRRFLTGLFIAYIAMVEELLKAVGEDSIDDALLEYPALDEHGGRKLNTLTIAHPIDDRVVFSLRTFYNSVEAVIRRSLRRPDYPNSAPHATQAWIQHKVEFELIASMSPGERATLADLLWAEVIAIPETKSTQGTSRGPRPFELLLTSFPGGVKGEPAGAVLQGLAYAYYRADSPTVTLRVHKTGAGSKRVGAIGDVDGWVGDVLGLTVEVKDHDMTEENLDLLASFVGELSHWPDATAIVLARSFTDETRKHLADQQILSFDRTRMASNVKFWDVPKQQLAVREFHHFVAVIQGSAPLTRRFQVWLTNELGHASDSEAED